MRFMITNNPEFANESKDNTVILLDDPESVFIRARDMIHQGYKLLTHPQYGNLQSRHWYYRTLLLSGERGDSLDYVSLQLIEDVIHKYLDPNQKRSDISATILEDYRLLDRDLIHHALDHSSSINETQLNYEGR